MKREKSERVYYFISLFVFIVIYYKGINNWGHILVASVAEIIMDPYYRTLEGFCVLVEKDWVSLRYPFEGISLFIDNITILLTNLIARCGFSINHKVAPYFEVFLIIVSYLYTLLPLAFQFNLDFLRDLEVFLYCIIIILTRYHQYNITTPTTILLTLCS